MHFEKSHVQFKLYSSLACSSSISFLPVFSDLSTRRLGVCARMRLHYEVMGDVE